MYLSRNWLEEYVKIPKTISSEELATRLSMHTVEVEKVEDQAKKFDNVVVGKILTVSPHPNSDRLQLAEVEVGTKKPLHIVCGAPNIASGQFVPVALIGAALPNGMVIIEREVRGEVSQGMLCAPDELGLGDDHNGILLLENRAKIGQSFAKYLGLSDVVLEVDNKSLSNRPDLWSHQGMAREIATFLRVKFSGYTANKKVVNKPTKSFAISVKNEAPELCRRYMAVGIENIVIAPSPQWLQQRLIAVGSRPINNVVDITNYVMFELGQPLHSFDQRKTNEIVVRRARASETLETLDGQQRALTIEMLVIADANKPVAVAGVMGGANTEIADDTTAIVFESANFDYVSVRKTSTALGLRTESSMRFEKGLDPLLAETALLRAVELILQLCPKAKVVTEVIDLHDANINEHKHVHFTLAWLNQFLGADIKASRILEILDSLGFEVKQKGEDLNVQIPSWRAVRDVSIKEDIAEEIARIHGYNAIQAALPEVAMVPAEVLPERQLEWQLKEWLAYGSALTEVYNYSFVGEEQLKKLFLDTSSCLRLVNPIASHQSLLRQSLAPGLIEAVKNNQPRYKEFGLFEIGSIYLDLPSVLPKDKEPGNTLPYQEKRLGIVLASDNPADLLRQAKGEIESVLRRLGLSAEWRPSELAVNWSEPQLSAELIVGGKAIGTVAQVSAKVAKSYGLKKSAAIVELSLQQLLAIAQKQGSLAYQPFDRFPPLVRDLAFVVNDAILYADIVKEIKNYNQLIKAVDLFDVFSGGKLGEGKKSLAFHVVYQAERTLTSEEVDKVQAGLLERLKERFDAQIRDF
ncbi:MAG: phenylalanine--tRNA ligase subunit beta [Candidatus Falkowbacteria bacterium]